MDAEEEKEKEIDSLIDAIGSGGSNLFEVESKLAELSTTNEPLANILEDIISPEEPPEIAAPTETQKSVRPTPSAAAPDVSKPAPRALPTSGEGTVTMKDRSKRMKKVKPPRSLSMAIPKDAWSSRVTDTKRPSISAVFGKREKVTKGGSGGTYAAKPKRSVSFAAPKDTLKSRDTVTKGLSIPAGFGKREKITRGGTGATYAVHTKSLDVPKPTRGGPSPLPSSARQKSLSKRPALSAPAPAPALTTVVEGRSPAGLAGPTGRTVGQSPIEPVSAGPKLTPTYMTTPDPSSSASTRSKKSATEAHPESDMDQIKDTGAPEEPIDWKSPDMNELFVEDMNDIKRRIEKVLGSNAPLEFKLALSDASSDSEMEFVLN
eukprot:171666_1